jgi:hypothetical protein
MAYLDDKRIDTSDLPPRKEYRKISILTDESILTSAYGLGQWVYYGKEECHLGQISGVSWQDKRPLLIYGTNRIDFRDDWEEGGFTYQIHEVNEYDTWENVPEKLIRASVWEGPSIDLDEIQRSYLEQVRLLTEIQDCYHKRKKQVPEAIFEALGFRSTWGKPKYIPGMHVRWEDEGSRGTGVIVRMERELDSEPGFWLYTIVPLGEPTRGS